MKNIDSYNFEGKRALTRVDFNVPLDDDLKITDTTRIDAALPTIRKVLKDGGSVILMSHLGRPKKKGENKLSLRHILPYLNHVLKLEVKFADDCMGDSAKDLSASLKPGEVLLLENLRFYEEEEGKPRLPETATDEEKKAAKASVKEKQKEFTKQLASYADCYINDAFGTAHRAHASTALIADYFPGNKMFGYLMNAEVGSLNKVLKEGEKPFTAVLGGAKVSGKIQIINHLLHKVDNLIVSGGMMFTFIKAMGGNIGKSLVEDDLLELAKNTLEGAKMHGVNLILPVDAIAADAFANDAKTRLVKADEIPDGWMGLDIGPQSIALFDKILMNSKTILWNGPMGVFEMPKFAEGTIQIAKSIANATQKGAFSLVGGGDSVAAVNKFKLADKISYVSTGGGAMLEFIEGKALPGVAAIEK
ncbi:MAG: phosphoglycerate kinase [Lentimicrobiaceae bacterium]|jgi:phosphoglycerate kinase|nr:phosphoglycerate kinase [Lentimicrobiaceae bacterium]MDD4597960.1 phosphoglycerate kinase [Lentimicrobiaceae bacterium]MDY0025951.1 phosphoglycerate kinase [Lentimicrobium sp.]